MSNKVETHCDPMWNDRVNMLAWKIQYEQPLDKSTINPYEIIAAKLLLKVAEKY